MSYQKLFIISIVLAITLFASAGTLAERNGALIYIERCALCHGNYGHGDGYIPLSVTQYPDTNLLDPNFKGGLEKVIEITKWGGSRGDMSPLSPPWKDELSEQEILSVSKFILKIQLQSDASRSDIETASLSMASDTSSGKRIFLSRCKICHGKDGKGDGLLSRKVITNPPPFNLTVSKRSNQYIRNIIENGGEFLGRSNQMPGWKYELLHHEIKSLVLYIDSIKQ